MGTVNFPESDLRDENVNAGGVGSITGLSRLSVCRVGNVETMREAAAGIYSWSDIDTSDVNVSLSNEKSSIG